MLALMMVFMVCPRTVARARDCNLWTRHLSRPTVQLAVVGDTFVVIQISNKVRQPNAPATVRRKQGHSRLAIAARST